MRYNMEKINQIGQLLAEVVEEAIETEGKEAALIAAILIMENDGQKPCQNKPNMAFSSRPRVIF
jgi:hypothetical protein